MKHPLPTVISTGASIRADTEGLDACLAVGFAEGLDEGLADVGLDVGFADEGLNVGLADGRLDVGFADECLDVGLNVGLADVGLEVGFADGGLVDGFADVGLNVVVIWRLHKMTFSRPHPPSLSEPHKF